MKLIKTAVVSLGVLSGAVLADDFFIDRFEIARDGSAAWFVDEFDDGQVPPSSEGTFPDGSFGRYSTRPSQLLGPEELGKLLLNPLLGEPTDPSDPDNSILIQRARLLTDTSEDPADSDLGLKAGIAFEVIGTFDLVRPQTANARYGIRISDLGVAEPDNLIQLRVELWPDGTWLVRFAESGDDAASFLELSRFDLGKVPDIGGYEQIVLRLTKAEAGTTAITASLTLIDSDALLTPVEHDMAGTATAFNGENWTRAAFFASVDQGLPPFTRLPPLITPLLLDD
jgi:hypothetical protein